MFKVNSERKERKERKEGREGGRKKEGLKEDWDLFFIFTKVKTEAHLFLLVTGEWKAANHCPLPYSQQIQMQ